MRICLIGAGRIGAVHAIAIASEEGATLHSVVDLNREAAENLAAQYSAQVLSICLLYTSPSPRDQRGSRMPSSA